MSKFSPIETTLYKSFGEGEYEIDIRIDDAGWDGVGPIDGPNGPAFDKGRYGVSDFTILSIRSEDGEPVRGAEEIIRQMYDSDFAQELTDDLDLFLSEREDDREDRSDE